MKKQLFSIMAVVAAVVFSLTSCSKEDTASPLAVDTATTAYIKGYLYYQPDLTASVVNAYPSSSDIKITATISYSSLNSHASSGALEIPVSYNQSTGMYTVEVPASTTAASVEIMFSGFAGSQRTSATTTKKGYWNPSLPVVPQTVVSGQTIVGPTVVYTLTDAPVQ